MSALLEKSSPLESNLDDCSAEKEKPKPACEKFLTADDADDAEKNQLDR